MDILQYVDNIQAAFHHILYHPDAMVMFAAVFLEFTIFPVGAIFSAWNLPPFFTTLSEHWAHVASTHTFQMNDDLASMMSLAHRVCLQPDLTDHKHAALVLVVTDGCHNWFLLTLWIGITILLLLMTMLWWMFRSAFFWQLITAFDQHSPSLVTPRMTITIHA